MSSASPGAPRRRSRSASAGAGARPRPPRREPLLAVARTRSRARSSLRLPVLHGAEYRARITLSRGRPARPRAPMHGRAMRPLAAAIVPALAALVLSAPAHADASFGVADDAGKYAEDGGAAFFGGCASVGLSGNRITVQWDADAPDARSSRQPLPRPLDAAGRRARASASSSPSTRAAGRAHRPRRTAPAQFAAFVAAARAHVPAGEGLRRRQRAEPAALLAAAVRRRRHAASRPRPSEPVLAAAYDALKAVDPAIRVIGVGLSERGNDNPSAPSNVSTSPIRFLRDLGAAYRASGRTTPIMDELVLHPYPGVAARRPAQVRTPWPSVGFGNLDRLKQALWDAFARHRAADGRERAQAPDRRDRLAGRGRRRPLAGLLLAAARPSPVTDEARQASIYGEARAPRRRATPPITLGLLLRPHRRARTSTACRPALLRANGSREAGVRLVRAAIAETGGRCAGTPRHLAAHDDGRRRGRRRSARPRARPLLASRRRWALRRHRRARRRPTARASSAVGARTRRAEIARALQSRACRVRADGHGRGALVARGSRSPRRRLPAGRYAYAIELAATMNPGAQDASSSSAPVPRRGAS